MYRIIAFWKKVNFIFIWLNSIKPLFEWRIEFLWTVPEHLLKNVITICSAQLMKKLSQKIRKESTVRPQQLQFNMQQTMWWMEGSDDMSFHLDWLKKIAVWSLHSGKHWNRSCCRAEDMIVVYQPERMRLNCKNPAVLVNFCHILWCKAAICNCDYVQKQSAIQSCLVNIHWNICFITVLWRWEDYTRQIWWHEILISSYKLGVTKIKIYDYINNEAKTYVLTAFWF